MALPVQTVQFPIQEQEKASQQQGLSPWCPMPNRPYGLQAWKGRPQRPLPHRHGPPAVDFPGEQPQVQAWKPQQRTPLGQEEPPSAPDLPQ